MMREDLIERLGFWIDRSGATAVLREVDGGCHPATRIELALWDALEAAREDAGRYRWLRKGTSDEVAVVRGLGAMDYGMSAVVSTYSEEIDGDDLDAAIDQARGKGVKDEA